MVKLLIAGSRHGSMDVYDYECLSKALQYHDVDLVIHGGASGIDTCADNWAKLNGIKVEVHKADWKNIGRGAGPIRNKEMVDRLGDDDLAIIFPGDTGTASTVRYLERAGFTSNGKIGQAEYFLRNSV